MASLPSGLRRFRPPTGLKRWLVPIWNAGYHSTHALLDRGGSLLRGQVERCAVCGRLALMIYRRRVIPAELARRWGLSERLARAVARKESSECSRCGAKLRGRRLAQVVLDLHPTEAAGSSPRSVVAWTRSVAANRLRVAEINRVEGLHDALRGLAHFQPSDYFAGAEPGSTVAGVRHEDLTCLTYPDASFDLVITSETLEHVPDLDRALSEIRRVLVPGGVHLCTVPLLPGVPRTFPRARLAADGSLIHLAAPIAHPGGDHGWPVFTEFGADFPAVIRAAGFDVEVRFGPTTEDDVAQVLVARKLAGS